MYIYMCIFVYIANVVSCHVKIRYLCFRTQSDILLQTTRVKKGTVVQTSKTKCHLPGATTFCIYI